MADFLTVSFRTRINVFAIYSAAITWGYINCNYSRSYSVRQRSVPETSENLNIAAQGHNADGHEVHNAPPQEPGHD